MPARCQDAFGVILNASDVVLTMSEGHDETLITHTRHFEAVGEIVGINYPRVIAAYFKLLAESLEEIVVGNRSRWCCHAVEYRTEVCKAAAETFAYSLMSEAHAKDWLFSGIGLYYIEQQTSLAWDSRSGREYYLVERLKLFQFELVVAENRYFCAQFLYQVAQIICKRVVIIYYYNFHCSYGL